MAQASLPHCEEVDHTADLALRIYGDNLAELFIHAAQAMFAYYGIADMGQATPHTHAIHIQGPDAETMLVDWLNELLYLAEVHEIVFTAFTVQQLTATSLDGQAQGYPLVEIQKAIKAVTFYDLAIVPSGHGLSVVITFDV